MITLTKNRQVHIDINLISIVEVREMLQPKCKQERMDALMLKTYGLTLADLPTLSHKDYRTLSKNFWAYINNPFKDEDDQKNLPNESTSVVDSKQTS
jgi:hypothetical protein